VNTLFTLEKKKKIKDYFKKTKIGDKMVKAQYNLKHKEVLDSFLLDVPIVKPGKMFGHPAYYVGGKLKKRCCSL